MSNAKVCIQDSIRIWNSHGERQCCRYTIGILKGWLQIHQFKLTSRAPSNVAQCGEPNKLLLSTIWFLLAQSFLRWLPNSLIDLPVSSGHWQDHKWSPRHSECGIASGYPNHSHGWILVIIINFWDQLWGLVFGISFGYHPNSLRC
jgi:hypothetical protein